MTYARRKQLRKNNGAAPVFRTEPFGRKLLTQLFQNILSLNATFAYDKQIMGDLVVFMREQAGVLALAKGHDLGGEFMSWWFDERPNTTELEHDLRLTALEAACSLALERAQAVDYVNVRSFGTRTTPAIITIIDTINAWMMEDGFGFQYQDGQLIEVTSQFAYQEVVVPALAILASPIFEAANSEFRDAFEEFKQRNYDDCIADCGKAFESVIKVIAAQKDWTDVDVNSNASALIKALYDHELIPSWMQEQMKGLRMMLMGVATVRNKEGGHGAGSVPRIVEKQLAAYQLNQTAAAIMFLTEQAGFA
ncbi:STM4504/CBY_0614 family protein [Sphingomonas sp. BAUL-RG-20F-R05-02]|uniref:STM4504/CBY_0614 family protein n=1 Tax=Sphingomonas sp. BAUL-RG-20F-R05-02 TaxID=2914830 RepID=UPI001F57CBEC|nr:hypothetical protein [Sphingomonas sp. BAUL-RG-20F-R05-02]